MVSGMDVICLSQFRRSVPYLGHCLFQTIHLRMKPCLLKDGFTPMVKVLLINQNKLLHYRIPVYNYLSAYLKRKGYSLTIVSEGTKEDNPHQIEFDHKVIILSFFKLARQHAHTN